MAIGSIGSSNPLLRDLQSAGISSQKAKVAADDITQALQSVGRNGKGAPDPAKVRDAVNERIADDVKSGKLSQADADKVFKTLDNLQAKFAANGPPPGAGPGGGGGAAGGGEASKVELSRTVTVSGGVRTTTIVYTDGSTETSSQVDTGAGGDDAKNGSDKVNQAANAPYAANPAVNKLLDYLKSVKPGSLFEDIA